MRTGTRMYSPTVVYKTRQVSLGLPQFSPYRTICSILSFFFLSVSFSFLYSWRSCHREGCWGRVGGLDLAELSAERGRMYI